MKRKLHKNVLYGVLLLLIAMLPSTAVSQIIGWNANANGGGFGVSPWTPASLNSNVTTSGLIRGSSIATSGGAAANAWGGSGGWSTTQSDANSFYFTMETVAGYKMSLSSISSATRRSNSGPTGSIVYYSLNGGAFVNAGSWTTTSTSGTTGTANSTDLSGIAELQNIAAGTVVKFRIIPQGTTGNYYLTGAANSLRVEGTVAAAISPLITPSVTTIPSFGSIVVGANSASANFTVSGEGLTGDLSIAAPAGFQISTDNINWYAGTDLSPVGGTLSNEIIYVRFSPLSTGPATGNITLTSTDAEDKLVALSGIGLPAASISVNPTSINSFAYHENGGPSAAFQLTNLTTIGLDPSSGNLTVSANNGATSNFEISADGINWSDSVMYPYTMADNDIDNPLLYIRLKAGLLQGMIPSEIITIAGGGLSTTISVSGTVNPPSTIVVDDEPYGSFCNTTSHSFDFDFTPAGTFNSPNYFAQLSNPDGTFPNTATNIVGTSTTSPVTVTIPANTVPGNYRVRIYNDNPLTFSSNDNGSDIVIQQASGLSGILQNAAVCSGSDASFTLSGLLPNGTLSLTYTIGSGASTVLTGVTADTNGEAVIVLPLVSSQNGATLTVTNIERTDVVPSCSTTITTNNSLVLAVNPTPTITAVNSTAVCGEGAVATINLTGLLPNSISTVTYTIAAGDPISVSNISSDGIGNASFDLPLTLSNDGAMLEITSITRTDNVPNCTVSLTGITTVLTSNQKPTGVISGDQTLCFGSTSGPINITLTGAAPWNLSYSDGSATYVLTNIAASPYTFTVNTFGTKTFTLLSLEDANCTATAADVSGSATVTIDALSVGGNITGSETFCNGPTSGDLNLINQVGNVIKWQSSSVVDFSIDVVDIENTTAVLSYGNLSSTTFFRAVVKNGACAETFSAAAAITVETSPAPAAAEQFFCSTATVADLMPNGSGIKWYTDATGGTALPTTALLTTATYFVSQTIDGCESDRTSALITISEPEAPVTTAQSFCVGATISDLQPNGDNIHWYASATAVTPLDGTTMLSSGNYFASTVVNECESDRTATSITVNEIPAPMTEFQEFCQTATVADLMPDDAGIQWYASATAETPLPVTQQLSQGLYYASLTVDGCESPRTVTAVSINTFAAPTAVAQTFCQQATVADLTPNGGGIQWYDSENGSEALTANTPLETGSYYVSLIVDGCESSKNMIAVTVNAPLIPNASAQTFCEISTVADLAPNGNGIQWFASATETTPLAANTTLASGSYFVSSSVDSCESERIAVSVVVETTTVPVGPNEQEFNENETIADLEVTGSNLMWYASAEDAEDQMDALDTNQLLVDGATYYVVSATANCQSEALAITVTEVLGTGELTAPSIEFYPNPVVNTLFLNNHQSIERILVYNMIGQQIMDQNFSGARVQLDMSALAAGSYVLQIFSGNVSQTIKVLKK